MAFDNTPNKLDAAFVQRDQFNQYYEQINVSGSNLIVYLDESGSITADRISIWAQKYNIGGGGTVASCSWASSSLSSSYALTASFALNGGSGGGGGSGSLFTASIVTNLINTNIVVMEVSASAFGEYFEYTVISGSNYRAGQIFGVNSASIITYSEYTTEDVGDTSGVTMSLDVSNDNVRLLVNVNTLQWEVNAMIGSGVIENNNTIIVPNISASYALTSSYALTTSTASYSNFALSSSYAQNAFNYLNEGVLNVKVYGAMGDGFTDDSAIIQSVLNMAVNKTVYFPQGTYAIGTPLTIPTNCTIHGAGKDSVHLLATTFGMPCVLQAGSASLADRIKIHDLLIQGNGNAVDGIVLGEPTQANGVVESIIDNVIVVSCTGNGIHAYGAEIVEFSNVSVVLCANGMLFDKQVGPTYNTDLFVHNANIVGCTNAGVEIKHVSGLAIRDSTIEGNYGYGILTDISASVYDVILDNIWFESNNSSYSLPSERAQVHFACGPIATVANATIKNCLFVGGQGVGYRHLHLDQGSYLLQENFFSTPADETIACVNNGSVTVRGNSGNKLSNDFSDTSPASYFAGNASGSFPVNPTVFWTHEGFVDGLPKYSLYINSRSGKIIPAYYVNAAGLLNGTASNAISSSYPWTSDGSNTSTQQNVGVKTNSPNGALDIHGNVIRSAINAGTFLTPAVEEGFVYKFPVNGGVTPAGLYFYNSAQSDYGSWLSLNTTDIYGNSGSRMVIDKFGNVGINLTTPVNRLDVGGNILCSVITASLFGTASYAKNASTASGISSISAGDNTLYTIPLVPGSGVQALYTAGGTTSEIAFNPATAVLSIGGSITTPFLTGTSSWANSASYVATASYYPPFPSTVPSASYVSSSVHIVNSDSSSYPWKSDGTNTTTMQKVGVGTTTPGNAFDAVGNISCNGLVIANSGAQIGGVSLGVPTQTTTQIGYSLDGTHDRTDAVQIGYLVGNNSPSPGAVQIGYVAGLLSPDAVASVQIGYAAGYNSIATFATQIGNTVGYACLNALAAVQIGYECGYYSTTASHATQIGFATAFDSTNADFATQIGFYTGYYSTIAVNAVQIGAFAGELSTTASNAVQVGTSAGANSTNAANAVQIGVSAGANATNAPYATYVGSNAGYNASSGSYATLIGANADATFAGVNVNKSIALGYNAKVGAPNTFVIGGTGADAVKVAIGATTAVNTLDVTGNILCNVITASLFNGPVISASYAQTASYAVATFVTSSTNFQSSASWASSSLSASYSRTSSYPWNYDGTHTWTLNNAGVGVTSPLTPLAVTNPYPSFGALVPIVTTQFANLSTLGGLYSVPGGNMNGDAGLSLQIYKTLVGLTEAMRIDTYGRAGFGTSQPTNSLDVVGNISCSVITASLLLGTASYANNAFSASYVPNLYPQVVQTTVASASWVSASVHIINSDTASYVAGGNVVGTVANATTAGTANAISFVPETAKSASWVSASVTINSASYARNASTASGVSSISTGDNTLFTIPLVPGSGVQSIYTAGGTTSQIAFNPGTGLLSVGGNIAASLFVGTASYCNQALSASYAPFTQTSIVSASWVSSSVHIRNSDTASYVAGANVDGQVANAGNANSSIYSTYGQYLYVNGETTQVRPVALYSGLGYSQFFGDTNSNITYDELAKTLNVPHVNGTASWATIATNAKTASAITVTDIGNPNYDYAFVFSDGYGNVSLKGNGGNTSLFSVNPGATYIKSPIFLGNLTGTASWANNLTGTITSASYAKTASVAILAISANNATTANSAISANSALTATSANSAITCITAQTASYVLASSISGKVTNAVTADTASYVAGSNVKGTVANATNASIASNVNISSDTSTNAERPLVFVPGSGTQTLYDGNATYNPNTNTITAALHGTASWATNVVNGGGSGPAIRAGKYSNVGDSEYSRTISFSSAMPNTNYSVVCQTLDNMLDLYFKVTSKNTTDFTVGFYDITSMGAPLQFSGAFDWQAIAYV